MSVRPAKKIQICDPTTTFFVQDEICVADGAGNVSEAMRFRTVDPTTLATIHVRLIDALTGLDVTGTPVACPCAANGSGRSELCAALAALPISGSNPVAATLFVGADCQKYTLTQLQSTLALALRGQEQTDAFGAVIGYLLVA